jgi:hypothetical protein
VKSIGDAAISPGTIRTCSMPARSSTGQSSSSHCAAKVSVPNDVRGAMRLAANARP